MEKRKEGMRKWKGERDEIERKGGKRRKRKEIWPTVDVHKFMERAGNWCQEKEISFQFKPTTATNLKLPSCPVWKYRCHETEISSNLTESFVKRLSL